MAGQLEGRVGVITGAARGIGAAGAKLFAAEGAAMVLVDIDAAQGQAKAAEITRSGGRAAFVRGDAGVEADIANAVRLAVSEFGKLDLLWANAGIGVAKTVPDMTLDEWTRVLTVNLTGAFLLAKYGIPELVRQGGGTMVISGSANSYVADKHWAAYCASKGGLLMLCKALAKDHAEQGVRVNIVCPGSVTTDLHEAWLRSRPGADPFEAVKEKDRVAHPMQRFATPEEVAQAALFLSSAQSSFTTGSAVLVDGGITA